MLAKDAQILLIEDDRVDVMTVQRALKKNRVSNPLNVARTGMEALHMLRGSGRPKLDPLPALVLLDLNLPGMSGIEFLREIRRDGRLNGLKVIVLSSSNEPGDRKAAFEYDVADYIVKPHSFNEFAQAMEVVLKYWEPEDV